MARFVTIRYGDREGYEATDPAALALAHEHDERLQADGVEIGIAGTPTQVRNTDGAGVTTTEGPFMSSALPVAGFSIIEARTLEEAVEMVSHSPCAVARGVVEVWPLLDPSA